MGVRIGEGDGTVNLISLGAMCVGGWKSKRWNPSGIQVKTIEVRVSFFLANWRTLFMITGIACSSTRRL